MKGNKISKINVSISGSFKKFLSEIQQYIRAFQDKGIQVLSPKDLPPTTKDKEFIFLETEEEIPIKNIEQTHLKSIIDNDFLYVVNPTGYVGVSTAFEIGFALALNKPIYAIERPTDKLIKQFVIPNDDINQVLLEIEKIKKPFNSTPIFCDVCHTQIGEIRDWGWMEKSVCTKCYKNLSIEYRRRLRENDRKGNHK
jgi:nucleoside 2-deoxyribosyltransferase